jgi:hypothetical protein
MQEEEAIIEERSEREDSQSHQAVGVIGIEHQITLIQQSNLRFRISPVKKRQEFIFLVEKEKPNDISNPQVASSEDAATLNDAQQTNN